MTFKTLLLTSTVLVFAAGAPAMADTVNHSSSTTLTTGAQDGVPAGAIKVDTDTDVKTNKVYNEDGEIVSTKTTTTTTDTYEYDVNRDQMMDESEYVTYSYSVIDYNNDGIVDDTEWRQYRTIWYQPEQVPVQAETRTFVSYDLNGDGVMDMTEYKSARDLNIYKAWDINHDGVVDVEEYQTITASYDDADKANIYTWHHLNN